MTKTVSEKLSTRGGAARPMVAGRRKSEAVVRLIAGEAAEDIATSLGVTTAEVERWRYEFVIAGERRMGELPLGVLERVLSPFERLVPLATLVSVAIGVFLFVQGQRHEREARNRENARSSELRVTESFKALDDKYIDYIKLCLEHPDLDVFDTPLERPATVTPEQKRRERMMFAILISVLERSYLMYRDQSDPFKVEEWNGWQTYIKSWVTRANFLDEWHRTKKEFDAAFVRYLDELIDKQKRGGS